MEPTQQNTQKDDMFNIGKDKKPDKVISQQKKADMITDERMKNLFNTGSSGVNSDEHKRKREEFAV